MSEYPIEIIRREDDAVVKATLHDSMKPEDLLLVEEAWNPVRLGVHKKLLREKVDEVEWPESLHWDWSKKARQLQLLQATGFGIMCDGSWEGAMLTLTVTHNARLVKDKGMPLVYIDYIETAPWNWPVQSLGLTGRYKGIGTILFRAAVQQSLNEEFSGRVGLHALPQAIAFYQDVCGMTDLGHDPKKENLLYFELSREQARKFLDVGGAT